MKTNERLAIVVQFGVTTEDGIIYEVIRDFFLQTSDGPLSVVKKGSRVLLAPKLGLELFYSGKTEPVELGETFEAITGFQMVGSTGEWIRVEVGDVVKLSRIEAIDLLRKGMVRERRAV